MIETLFTAQKFVSSPSFDRLREMRRIVLTPTLVDEFLSYVKGQIVVHQKKGLKGKRLYHILRIMFELERIVNGDEPLIWLPVRGEPNALLTPRHHFSLRSTSGLGVFSPRTDASILRPTFSARVPLKRRS